MCYLLSNDSEKYSVYPEDASAKLNELNAKER